MTNLMHKFLIHLLQSSTCTCFEHAHGVSIYTQFNNTRRIISNFIIMFYAYKQYSKLYYSNFRQLTCFQSDDTRCCINPLNPELNPICYLLALLGAHHFLHVSRIRVKLLTFRLLMSYIYGAPILDVSRSHTTTQHSR